jgi:SAM-dependent methyltransferase
MTEINSASLNLGCGDQYDPSAVNVDFYAERVDVRHNLDMFPYPFEDGTFDEIVCLNVVEHLVDVIRVMNEIHRIGKANCKVLIRVPHFRSACLYEDLTHRHGFAWRSFDIFTERSSVYGNYSPARFDIISREYTPYKWRGLYRLLSRFPILTDNLLSKFVPMASIVYVMQVNK